MTRVFRRATSTSAVRARTGIPKAKVRKHKIIMESVTQEKKKLRSVITFEAKAPPGYTFIPAGNPVFTNACKEMCRKDGLKVFTVSTTPHQRMHNLSQQVHRIGCHFPSVVVATICMERGLFLSSTGKVMPYNHATTHCIGDSRGREQRADSVVSQNTINMEARDAIKDLFPNIPEKDLNQIIKTAFQKGKRKVGTAVELPLARRVQLAVVAHIRHVYTEYDRLLKITSFPDARAAVEEPCLAKLVQWRGDDENGTTVLEDVFREVIVISDDDNDGEESDAYQASEHSRGGRDSSVEIVSSNALTGDLYTRPINYGKLSGVDRATVQEISEDEAPSGFRFIPEVPRRRKAADKKKIDRRGFSRYQAWDRAKDRYRDDRNEASQTKLSFNPAEYYPPRAIQEPLMASNNGPTGRLESFRNYESPTSTNRSVHPLNFTNQGHPQEIQTPRRSSEVFIHSNIPESYTHARPPDLLHFPDGTVFERAPRGDHGQISNPPNFPPSAASPKDPTPILGEQVRYHMMHNSPLSRSDTRHAQEHRALPSIEGPPPLSQLRRQGLNQMEIQQLERVSRGTSTHHLVPLHPPMEDLSGKINIININADRAQFPLKRKREEYSTVASERSPLQKCGNGMRFNVPRDFDKPKANFEEGRYVPTNSDPAGNRNALPLLDGYRLPFNEQSEVLGRQSDKYPVGRTLPAPIPLAPYSDDSYDRGRGRQYGAPVLLQESHHGFSSHNTFIKSPTVISKYGDSGYMVRNDGSAVRSSHVFPLIRPNVQLIDVGDHEIASVQKTRQLRDPSRSLAVQQDMPNEQSALSGPHAPAPDIYSHDFVRHVQIRNMKESYRDNSQCSAPQEHQTIPAISHHTRYVPVPSEQVAFGQNNRSFTSRDMCRSLSPHAIHQTSRVALPGLRSAFQVQTDSGRRPPYQYLPQPHPVTVLRDARNDLPLNDGRFCQEYPPRGVAGNDGARPETSEHRVYYEPIPPRDQVFVLGD